MNNWIDNLLHFEELIQCFRIIVALILGACIGFEREKYGRPAGLRTHMLVCVAASLAMILSLFAFESGDPARLAAQVITGIGFIGAGAIIRGEGNIIGITTAATIFVCSIIGLASGAGNYFAAIITTILALVILSCFTKVESRLSTSRKYNTHLNVIIKQEKDTIDRLKDFLNHSHVNLDSIEYKSSILDGERVYKVTVTFEKKTRVNNLNEFLAGFDKEFHPLQCKITNNSYTSKRHLRD